MKRICGITVALLMAVSLLPGCSCGDGEALQAVEDQLTAVQDQLSTLHGTVNNFDERVKVLEGIGTNVSFISSYTGFTTLEEGQWASYNILVDPTIGHATPVPYFATYGGLGTEVVDKGVVDGELVELPEGKMCIGFQITCPFRTITELQWRQSWYDVDTNELVIRVTKAKGVPMTGIVTPDIDPLPEYLWARPVTYLDYFPNLGYRPAVYPFPPGSPRSGEQIDCAVFTINGSQHWVSSEIPLGFVQQVDKGVVHQCLWDYGLTGAARNITAEDRERAVPMPPEILPGPY